MMKNNGTGLENFVYELFKDLGYMDVTKNYLLSKKNGEESARGQIDITYKQFLMRRYVECKQRTAVNVTFDDYAKFETTLKTFNIPTFSGELITNTHFDTKVKLRAKETRIRLIDREELIRLNDMRKSIYHSGIMVFRFIEIFDGCGLKKALDYLILRNLSMDQQIKRYTE